LYTKSGKYSSQISVIAIKELNLESVYKATTIHDVAITLALAVLSPLN
jgi:hypothetical protein